MGREAIAEMGFEIRGRRNGRNGRKRPKRLKRLKRRCFDLLTHIHGPEQNFPIASAAFAKRLWQLKADANHMAFKPET